MNTGHRYGAPLAAANRCDGLGTVTAPPGLNPDEVPGYHMIREAIAGTDAIYIRTCPRCAGKGRTPGQYSAAFTLTADDI